MLRFIIPSQFLSSACKVSQIEKLYYLTLHLTYRAIPFFISLY